MRISADRYNRERLYYDLALRMMGHGARISTVHEWTGLSIDRLRKLYRAYLLHRTDRTQSGMVRWPRGKAPRSATSFLQSSALGFEATTFACLMRMLGIIDQRRVGLEAISGPEHLRHAEDFCQAYEIYLTLHSTPLLSFEHARLLLLSLIQQGPVKLECCGQCKRLYLADAVRIETANCGCRLRHLGLPQRRPRKSDSVRSSL